MTETVVVTSLGSVSGDIVIKGLHKEGMRVVGCSIYPAEWVADSLEVDAYYKVPLTADAEGFLATMADICKKEQASYIFPLIDLDVDLFNANRAWAEDLGVTVCFSTKHALDIIRNKKDLADFIAAEVPEVVSIPTLMLKDVDTLPWEFPVVCKLINGRSSQGLRYIHSQAEWDAFRGEVNLDAYIVEPFIEGPTIVVEIIRQPQTGSMVAIPREELISTPHGCGLTVRTYRDPKLEESCKVLAERLGIVGNVNYEFLRDPQGVYHFVECNPRFSAGTKFICIAGYNTIRNHLRCFTGQEIEPCEHIRDLIIARKYEEYVMCEC